MSLSKALWPCEITRTLRGATVSILAAGYSLCATAAPGDLDVSFGNNGSAGFAIHSIVGGSNHEANAIAAQADGRIILAGACQSVSGKDSFCVIRMTADGERDNTFVAGSGSAITDLSVADDVPAAIAIQPNGRIVVAGSCADDFCVARYNINGSLDTSFNATGKRLVSISAGRDSASGVAIQPDGKIVIAGTCEFIALPNPSRDDFCVIRLNSDGSLDSGFGSGGRVTTSVGSGNARAYAMALHADGKILLAGSCTGATNTDFCLVRYLPTGALDNSSVANVRFDIDGKRIQPIGLGSDTARSLIIQPDEKIVAAGTCDVGTDNRFCIARFNYNGTLDTSFSTNGYTTLNPNPPESYGTALAIQPDGKLVVAGDCNRTMGSGEACISRLEPDGGIDATFSGNAVPVAVVSDRDRVNAVLIQANGKIVSAGGCRSTLFNATYTRYCAIRYESGPFAYRQCSLDVDGNGSITATVDGLILTRVMLGLTGNAVISGISFPSTAVRKVWGGGAANDIRQYLVSHCGMNL